MKPFTGTWRITSSPDFSTDQLNQSGLPYIRLRQQGGRIEGEYAFGLQQGHFDGRPDGEDRIILSFEGMDDEELVNGAGLLSLREDHLHLTLMYHFGPDRILEGRRQAISDGSAHG